MILDADANANANASVSATADPDANTLPLGKGKKSHHKEGAICLALRGVTKRFGEVAAIEDISLDVEPGEVVVLLGPSGSGKTTLLRLIAGLERPDAGSIALNGNPVADPEHGVWVPPERRRVGFVFQDYALFPHMTAWQNVAFALPHLSRRERRAQAQAMLEQVGVSHLARRYPHELSGGEQQRVALARALAPRPRVLLLDEPFSHLDRGLRVRLRAELKGLLQRLGITAVFVTHDQEEAFEMGDRLVVLHRGRIEQIGPPCEFLQTPKTRFVEEFFGFRSAEVRWH